MILVIVAIVVMLVNMAILINLIEVGTQKKIRDYLGTFPNIGGGGLPNFQFIL